MGIKMGSETGPVPSNYERSRLGRLRQRVLSPLLCGSLLAGRTVGPNFQPDRTTLPVGFADATEDGPATPDQNEPTNRQLIE